MVELNRFFQLRMSLEDIDSTFEDEDMTSEGHGLPLIMAQASILGLDMESLHVRRNTTSDSVDGSFLVSIINRVKNAVKYTTSKYAETLKTHITNSINKLSANSSDFSKEEFDIFKKNVNAKVTLKEVDGALYDAMMTFHAGITKALPDNNFEYIANQPDLANKSIQTFHTGRGEMFIGYVEGTFSPITNVIMTKTFKSTKFKINKDARTLSTSNMNVKVLLAFLDLKYTQNVIKKIETKHETRADDISKLISSNDDPKVEKLLRSLYNYTYETMAVKIKSASNAHVDAVRIAKFVNKQKG